MATKSSAKGALHSVPNPRFAKERTLPAPSGNATKERVVKPAPFTGVLTRKQIKAAVDAVVSDRKR